MRRNLCLHLVLGILIIAGASPIAARGDSSSGVWIDAKPLHNWNAVARPIPKAPAPAGDPATSGMCARTVRPASTSEDRAVTGAGWKLFRPYELFGTTSLVAGMASTDGMCRPLQFNVFVFSHGRFAGTISPVLMNSRTDGGLQDTYLTESVHVTATFSRYNGSEPLCCPSRTSTVEYAVTSSHGMPLLMPTAATTISNSQ